MGSMELICGTTRRGTHLNRKPEVIVVPKTRPYKATTARQLLGFVDAGHYAWRVSPE